MEGPGKNEETWQRLREDCKKTVEPGNIGRRDWKDLERIGRLGKTEKTWKHS